MAPTQVNVIGPRPTVFQVRLGYLQNGLTQGRHAQPLRHLMAQNTHALGDGADVLFVFAFSGNDQHQSQAIGLGIQDKADQVRVGLGQGQAVQIDAGFG